MNARPKTRLRKYIEDSVAKDPKPTYSPSRLAMYARCPRMFDLSRRYESQPSASTEAILRNGQLFEGYLFGFKQGDLADGREDLEGRKKTESLSKIAFQANYVAPIFEHWSAMTHSRIVLKEMQARALEDEVKSRMGRRRKMDDAEVARLARIDAALESVRARLEKEAGEARADYESIYSGNHYGPYQRLCWETDDYIVRGEADYIGPIDLDAVRDITLVVEDDFEDLPEGTEWIIDLKFTGDISRTWDFKALKEDFLQSAFYPFMHWKTTGELLPFAYVVVEDMYNVPIVRFIRMKITERDFEEFLIPLIERVHYDMLYKPFANPLTCLGSRSESRCWFMDYCEHGRKVVGGYRSFDFRSLNTNYSSLYKKEQDDAEG